MEKLNQIRRAIILGCLGLVFGGVANSGAEPLFPQPPRNLGIPIRVATTEVGLDNQQTESSPRKIEGDWEGILDAGAVKLRLVLHVVRKDGALTATLDSPDQGAMGLVVDSITVKSTAVRFEMKSLGGVYEGQLNKDDSQIEGQWTQVGQTFPLVLKRLGD